MVYYWFCKGCNGVVDEFTREYGLEEKDKKKLCKKCRDASKEQDTQSTVKK